MSRRRYISTDISIDKQVNRMGTKYGDGPVLLYTWMIIHASDLATITGDTYELLNMVWPGRRDKTEQDVGGCLAAMKEFRLAVLDETESLVYFPIRSFYKYQTYVKKENRRMQDHPFFTNNGTAEIIEEQRESLKIIEDHCATAENAASLSLSHSLSLSPPLPSTRERDACEADEPEIVNTPEPEAEPEAPDIFAEVVRFYQDNHFRPPFNDFKRDEIRNLCEEFQPDMIREALAEAGSHNAKSLKYVESTLVTWTENGGSPSQRRKEALSDGANRRNHNRDPGADQATAPKRARITVPAEWQPPTDLGG